MSTVSRSTPESRRAVRHDTWGVASDWLTAGVVVREDCGGRVSGFGWLVSIYNVTVIYSILAVSPRHACG